MEKNEYKIIVEEKLKIVNDLTAQLNYEISKIVTCDICKRKFANKAHLLRHITSSEIHKINSKNIT